MARVQAAEADAAARDAPPIPEPNLAGDSGDEEGDDEERDDEEAVKPGDDEGGRGAEAGGAAPAQPTGWDYFIVSCNCRRWFHPVKVEGDSTFKGRRWFNLQG